MADVTELKPAEAATFRFDGAPQLAESRLHGLFSVWRHGHGDMVSLEVGQVVRLTTKGGKALGEAVVCRLHLGVLEHLLDDEALLLDHYTNPDDKDELRDLLFAEFGRDAVRRGEKYTVIDMVRIRR
jgi:hypothetical protein